MINLKTVIYADVLFILNFIVNYLLLRACTVITGHGFRTFRLIISAVIGGIFSFIIFIDDMSVSANIIIKVILMSFMIIVAFGIKSIKIYLKCCASFFLVNFGFAGIMLGLCTNAMPHSSVYKNGIVYFDISIFTLTSGAIICYIILSLISHFIKSKVPQKSIYSIRVSYDGKTAEGKALYDSGNTLCDCFSGKPVIIAENKFISKLCSDDITSMKNFRLIPFSTIKDSGALPAFLAEKTEIRIDGKWYSAENIYIAITNKKIVSGEYSALFGLPYLETVETGLKGGTVKI